MTMFYPPGRYRCRIEDQGFQTASTGNPMIVFKVRPFAEIVQGPEGPEDQHVDGKYDRTIRLTVTDKSQEMVLKKLRLAGFDGVSFRDMDLLHRDVECECSPDKYEGKDVERWDLALPPREAGPPFQPLDSKAARSLDTLFGKSLKETAVKKEKPEAAPAPASVGNDDPDVPF